MTTYWRNQAFKARRVALASSLSAVLCFSVLLVETVTTEPNLSHAQICAARLGVAYSSETGVTEKLTEYTECVLDLAR